MGFVVLLICVVGIGVFLYVAWKKVGRRSDIVQCASCKWRGTRKRFEDSGGCPLCGSDIFYETGKRAN